jgi:hypothetical protein
VFHRRGLESSVGFDQAVEAGCGNEARPDADHGVKVHGMELFVHGDGIRPFGGIDLHFAHLFVMEPVHDEVVDREVSLSVPLCYSQQFLLAGVALLALDVGVGRFENHRSICGEEPVASIDLVAGGAGDHEEGDALTKI